MATKNDPPLIYRIETRGWRDNKRLSYKGKPVKIVSAGIIIDGTMYHRKEVSEALALDVGFFDGTSLQEISDSLFGGFMEKVENEKAKYEKRILPIGDYFYLKLDDIYGLDGATEYFIVSVFYVEETKVERERRTTIEEKERLRLERRRETDRIRREREKEQRLDSLKKEIARLERGLKK